MNRTADYTILGFLYQFNKTIVEILGAADDAEITVEGIIEDIDVATPTSVSAIQCKYHEGAEKFTHSLIYKPLLQMMRHHHTTPSSDVSYRLYAYFPSETPREVTLTPSEAQAALKTTNAALNSLALPLRDTFDVAPFLERFILEFGISFDDLSRHVCRRLAESGIDNDAIDILAYPNALNHIATLSTRHNEAERRITKRTLIRLLQNLRRTAISRWTLSLQTRGRLLEARRKQLKLGLGFNVRRRRFLISAGSIGDFENRVVQFMKDFVDKYHYKPAHTEPPVFCLDCPHDLFDDVCDRLENKGVGVCDGYKRKSFKIGIFYQQPHNTNSGGRKAVPNFRARLCRFEDSYDVLNHRPCEDIFVVSSAPHSEIEESDVNVERLAVNTFDELSYVLGISHAPE